MEKSSTSSSAIIGVTKWRSIYVLSAIVIIVSSIKFIIYKNIICILLSFKGDDEGPNGANEWVALFEKGEQ
jgi:hypothetical protein